MTAIPPAVDYCNPPYVPNADPYFDNFGCAFDVPPTPYTGEFNDPTGWVVRAELVADAGKPVRVTRPERSIIGYGRACLIYDWLDARSDRNGPMDAKYSLTITARAPSGNTKRPPKLTWDLPLDSREYRANRALLSPHFGWIAFVRETTEVETFATFMTNGLWNRWWTGEGLAGEWVPQGTPYITTDGFTPTTFHEIQPRGRPANEPLRGHKNRSRGRFADVTWFPNRAVSTLCFGFWGNDWRETAFFTRGRDADFKSTHALPRRFWPCELDREILDTVRLPSRPGLAGPPKWYDRQHMVGYISNVVMAITGISDITSLQRLISGSMPSNNPNGNTFEFRGIRGLGGPGPETPENERGSHFFNGEWEHLGDGLWHYKSTLGERIKLPAMDTRTPVTLKTRINLDWERSPEQQFRWETACRQMLTGDDCPDAFITILEADGGLPLRMNVKTVFRHMQAGGWKPKMKQDDGTAGDMLLSHLLRSNAPFRTSGEIRRLWSDVYYPRDPTEYDLYDSFVSLNDDMSFAPGAPLDTSDGKERVFRFGIDLPKGDAARTIVNIAPSRMAYRQVRVNLDCPNWEDRAGGVLWVFEDTQGVTVWQELDPWPRALLVKGDAPDLPFRAVDFRARNTATLRTLRRPIPWGELAGKAGRLTLTVVLAGPQWGIPGSINAMHKVYTRFWDVQFGGKPLAPRLSQPLVHNGTVDATVALSSDDPVRFFIVARAGFQPDPRVPWFADARLVDDDPEKDPAPLQSDWELTSTYTDALTAVNLQEWNRRPTPTWDAWPKSHFEIRDVYIDMTEGVARFPVTLAAGPHQTGDDPGTETRAFTADEIDVVEAVRSEFVLDTKSAVRELTAEKVARVPRGIPLSVYVTGADGTIAAYHNVVFEGRTAGPKAAKRSLRWTYNPDEGGSEDVRWARIDPTLTQPTPTADESGAVISVAYTKPCNALPVFIGSSLTWSVENTPRRGDVLPDRVDIVWSADDGRTFTLRGAVLEKDGAMLVTQSVALATAEYVNALSRASGTLSITYHTGRNAHETVAFANCHFSALAFPDVWLPEGAEVVLPPENAPRLECGWLEDGHFTPS